LLYACDKGLPHIPPDPSPRGPEIHAFGSSHALLVDPTRRLTEQDYVRLDHLLGKHFAEVSLEILKLVAFCWVMLLLLAVIGVSALR